MIKLIAIEKSKGTQLLLRFSDGAWGTYDFAPFVEAATEMTEKGVRFIYPSRKRGQVHLSGKTENGSGSFIRKNRKWVRFI